MDRELESADDGLVARLDRVRAGVAEAASDAGRDPSAITTIVVTKFQSIDLIRQLIAVGVRDLGESRLQELRVKHEELGPDAGAHWHFIGQLQSKKAGQVRSLSDAIHSVDRDSLVAALNRGEGERTDVFLQVDLSGEPGRGGAPLDGIERLAESILATSTLRLLGVMAVAPLGQEPRRAFSRLREVSGRVRGISPDAEAISAGMSGDYPDAVREGATHLRIGTAITGNRLTGR